MNFVEKIIEEIEEVFEKVENEVKDVAQVVITDANKVVNAIMAAEQSPGGQEVIKILEGIFPAADPAIDAISLALPVIAMDMKWAQTEIGKTDDEIFQDAWDYLKNAVGSVKANQLNAFAALIGEILNGIEEGILTIQQLITFAQSAHAPLLAVS